MPKPLANELPSERTVKPCSAREWLIIALSAVLSLVAHAHYMLSGLGERDAARFARIAFAWHLHGKISFDDVGYQVRTSTLYLDMERLALDHGLSFASLPSFVNWVSVFFGTACSVALYFLFRRVTTRRIAATATVVYALTPGFWLGNIYGMPTIPSLFFFILALILFLDATRLDQRSAAFFLRVGGALALMWLAMTLKSDIVLSGGAFLAVAFLRPARRFRLCCYATVIVVGATLGSLLLTRLVVAPATAVSGASAGLLEFFKNWNKSFAIELSALFDQSNGSSIVRCAGGMLFCVILLSLLHGLVVGGTRRNRALLVALWGLPPILAWGVRAGNAARHSVPAFPPLVLLAVLFLFESVGTNERRGMILVAVTMVLSYFSNLSGVQEARPQSNLIGLSEAQEGLCQQMHDHARRTIRTPGVKRVLIAGWIDPYAEYELFVAAKHPVIEIGDHWTLFDGERTTIIDYGAYLERKSPRALARAYRRRGFEPMSMSYRF